MGYFYYRDGPLKSGIFPVTRMSGHPIAIGFNDQTFYGNRFRKQK